MRLDANSGKFLNWRPSELFYVVDSMWWAGKMFFSSIILLRFYPD